MVHSVPSLPLQPIAHRDLKPANLMISGNLHADVEQLILDSGIVRIVDFGEWMLECACLQTFMHST